MKTIETKTKECEHKFLFEIGIQKDKDGRDYLRLGNCLIPSCNTTKTITNDYMKISIKKFYNKKWRQVYWRFKK